MRDMPSGSELVLGSEAMATPSALDLAFQRGVRVVYADGVRAVRKPVAAESELWSRIVAEDGTYVVEVKHGVATAHRVTPGGPALVSGSGGAR